jgi:hypothetical protein
MKETNCLCANEKWYLYYVKKIIRPSEVQTITFNQLMNSRKDEDVDLCND